MNEVEELAKEIHERCHEEDHVSSEWDLLTIDEKLEYYLRANKSIGYNQGPSCHHP